MPTPGTYTVEIPTRPYLAKYVMARYGNPVQLSNNDLIGIVILSLLQKRVYIHKDLKTRHLQYMSYTYKMTCVAKWTYMRGFGIDLTDDQIIQINRYLDAQFTDDLYKFVQFNLNEHHRYKGYDQAIHKFAEAHGIILGIDTSFECLKKAEYRYRKKLENILPTNVPSLLQQEIGQATDPRNFLPTNVPSNDPLFQQSLF